MAAARHFEVFVEEESAEAVLSNILPAILVNATFEIHVFQGKPDLLHNLPARFRGYHGWLPDDWRIVVLLDADEEDCLRPKGMLEAIAQQAGLLTRAQVAPGMPFQVINRLAVEELEAWFFGDGEAIHAAFPRVSASIGHQRSYRHPDAIRGGTWEALHRVLQRAGYYQGLARLPKIEVALKISRHMEPSRNRSQSFQTFYRGLRDLVEAQ